MELDMVVVEDLRGNIEKNLHTTLQENLIFITLQNPDILNRLIPKYGMSLFHMSVGWSNNDVAVVKVLMDHGADPNNTNCDDKVSPLHLSILYEFDVVMDFLLRHGGDPYIQDGESKNCYDLVDMLDEPDIFRSILVKHTSFNALSSIGSDGGSGVSGDTAMSFMTCLTSSDHPDERTNFFTEDEEDDDPPEKMKRRYGFLSTIREETSSVMNAWNRHSHMSNRNSTNHTVSSVEGRHLPSPPATPVVEYSIITTMTTPVVTAAMTTTSTITPSPAVTPSINISKPSSINITENSNAKRRDTHSSAATSPTHSVASTPSDPPSPTHSEMDNLRTRIQNLNLQYPVTASTFHTISKFMSPNMAQFQLTATENQYSSELLAAIEDLSIVDRLKYGDLKIEVAQDAASDSPKRNGKSYYNYVLLDPKVIKRINLSGDHLKSDVIKNSEKFRKFISAIFYIGKGCGKRPIKHLEDAKVVYSRKIPPSNEKIKQILDIWKSGQGVIVHSCFHHSQEREANVNEASMIDAMGLKELSNLKKGSYSGEMVSKWNQKQKNQFGVFLLRTVFSLYAVSNGTIKELFPHDI